jgi:hypothetical protein
MRPALWLLCLLGCAPAAPTIATPPPAPTDTFSATAVEVSKPTIRSIAAGAAHTCAVLADGTIRCWGANGFGQLGDGSQRTRATPAPVAGVPAATAVEAFGDHSCALTEAGDVYCWGVTYGEWADQERGLGFSTTARKVAGLSGIQQVVLGADHAAALDGDGKVLRWGGESVAVLWPDRSVDDRRAAHRGQLLGTYRSIAIGRTMLCGVSSTGLECARLHFEREWNHDCLGEASKEAGCQPFRMAVPDVRFASMQPIDEEDLLDDAVCVVRESGAFECARRLREEASDEPRAWSRLEPVTLPPIASQHGSLVVGRNDEAFVVQFSAHTSCAEGGCVPRRVPFDRLLKDSSELSMGDHHSCVVRSAEIVCWGDNTHGQLGDGTREPSAEPKTVKLSASAAAPKNELSQRLSDLAQSVPDKKLSGFGFVWANAEVFHSPNESSLAGRLANYDDDLLLELGQPRVLVSITEDRGMFVGISIPRDTQVERHCGAKLPRPGVALRGFVRRSALAPTISKKTHVAFDDGSLDLLPGTPLFLEPGGLGALVFGERERLELPETAISFAYTPVRQSKLEDESSFSVFLGDEVFKSRSSKASITLPDGDGSDENTPASPAKIRHACTEASARQVVFDGFDGEAEPEPPERGYGLVGSDRLVKWPSGKHAGVLTRDLQFRGDLTTRRGDRVCFRAVGSIELCFDADDVLMSALENRNP